MHRSAPRWKRFHHHANFRHRADIRHRGAVLLATALVLTACSASEPAAAPADDAPAAASAPATGAATSPTSPPPAAPATTINGPRIDGVVAVADEITTYGRLDLTADITAEYDNPFDQREIALDAVFTSPNGDAFAVPAFWNDEVWGLRFTPDEPGDWTYSVTVTDHRGTSEPHDGTFSVAPSDHKGFVRVGSDIDPTYSDRYFAHDDGTPWFGIGHADLDMSWDGYSGDTFRKMAEMPAAGENFEMWWPQWTLDILQNAYDDYNMSVASTIDFVLDEAEKNDIQLAFTIWIHQLLRTPDHAWGTGEWNRNGFNKLVDRPEQFFVDDESWAWQENYYRYVIARWGHSPAIAMWQTITEVNGTNSYEQTDPWHDRVNEYFQTNDPYHHPTTATGSGGYWWPTAFATMDVPQMHVYEQFHANPIEAAEIMANWTQAMWAEQPKPNWIGEYGESWVRVYPEFSHNANWATLAAGGATSPIEWNDGQQYGRFTDEQAADMKRYSDFVAELPLVQIVPEQLAITTSDDVVRGWGIGSAAGGVAWLQDFTGQATSIDDDEDPIAMRARPPRPAMTATINGLPDGDYEAVPYDTWTGDWLAPVPFTCVAGSCDVPIPEFAFDIALRVSGN